jgi:hypothetical protein
MDTSDFLKITQIVRQYQTKYQSDLSINHP